jgi:hypothetical protein
MTSFTLRTSLLVLLAVCVCALPAGCGGTYLDGVRIYPVSGTILVDGKPLTDVPQGSVAFHADAAKGNTPRTFPPARSPPTGNSSW